MERGEMTRQLGGMPGLLAAAAIGVLAALTAPSVMAGDPVEEAYWTMIHDRKEAELFADYLARYPQGDHADEARTRLEALQAATPAADVASPAAASAGDAPARSAESLVEAAVAAEARNDMTEAARLYGQAAALGSATAHAQLGYMLQDGRGVAQDLRAALEHFTEAAGLGVIDSYPPAISLLDIGYRPSLPSDPARAAELILAFARAAAARAVDSLSSWNEKTIAALQKKLTDAGFYTSKIDGKTGPGTRAALAAYAAADPAGAVQAETALVMSWQGVGGITGETPYEAEALRALLPGYEVAVSRRTVEGMSEVSFVVRKDGRDMLLIHNNGNAVGSITAVGDGVADEAGLTIGKSTFADFGPPDFVACFIQEETDTPLIVCEEPDSFVTHLFATPKQVKAGDDGRVPQQAIPPQSVLKRMVWYAAG